VEKLPPRTSSSRNSILAPTLSRFVRLPVRRLSTTVTTAPAAARLSTRCDPMNPAPPVTSTAFPPSPWNSPRVMRLPYWSDDTPRGGRGIGPSGSSGHVPEEVDLHLHEARKIVLLDDARTCTSGERLRKLRLVDEAAQAPRERLGIVRRKQQPDLTVGEDRAVADDVRRDAGHARTHGLKEYLWVAFSERRQHEHVGLIEGARQLTMVHHRE